MTLTIPGDMGSVNKIEENGRDGDGKFSDQLLYGLIAKSTRSINTLFLKSKANLCSRSTSFNSWVLVHLYLNCSKQKKPNIISRLQSNQEITYNKCNIQQMQYTAWHFLKRTTYK